MTKSELINRIAERFPALTTADAYASVDLILKQMTSFLVRGVRIEIRGFGSFSLNHQLPRVGRNPKTGEQVTIPAKYVPHFRAGKELLERVQPSMAMAKTAAR